jgi:hypothetical protein
MATEQNRCAETQHLLSGSSLKLAVRQAGIQRLVGDVSKVPTKFRKYIFFLAFAQHFPSWEAGLLAPCAFKVCLAQPRQ